MACGQKNIVNKVLTIVTGPTDTGERKTRVEAACDQLVNSIIVGGISGVSAYAATGAEATGITTAILAGALTALIKLKEYRNIT